MKIARIFVLFALFVLVGAASLRAQNVSVNSNGPNGPSVGGVPYVPPYNPLVGATTIPIPSDGQTVEYVILSGGPSLIQWEKYKASPHDQFWGGFVRAARTRIQLLTSQLKDNPYAKITWLVYLDGYRARAKQDQQDLLANIYSVRDKYKVNFVPVENGKDVIAYLNNGQPRDRIKIIDFEYFGHSNRACFMFDYSNNIDSASKAWLHEDELTNLKRNLFTRNAFVKSWGCHTGESMSKKFYAATGTKMIGAIGRTDYSFRDEVLNGVFPVLSSVDGKWAQ